MVTLAFAQMLYYFAQSLRNWGGDDGFSTRRRNDLGFLSLENHEIFYYVVLILLVLVCWLSYRLVRSEFGMVIRGIRDNERRAAAIGFPPYPYKLVIFVIAGGIAGLAGALMANHAKFVNPAVLSWQLSGELLAMVILGSANSLIGPILGAAFFLAFRDVLSDYTEHWMLFFGPLLVARVLLMRDGIWGMLMRATGTGEAPREPKVDFPEAGKPVEPKPSREQGHERVPAEIEGLRKSFGALVATDNVTLNISTGETHALIGPNGAGKTTLVGQLTGELTPGRRNASASPAATSRRCPPHNRARLGLARSFQITSIFPTFTSQGKRGAGGAGDRAAQLPVLAAGRADREVARAGAQALADVGLGAGSAPRRGAPCRTASIASSRLAWRWRPGRPCCCSTSRWPGSASKSRARCRHCWRASRAATPSS